jgi:hypothetical protein
MTRLALEAERLLLPDGYDLGDYFNQVKWILILN